MVLDALTIDLPAVRRPRHQDHRRRDHVHAPDRARRLLAARDMQRKMARDINFVRDSLAVRIGLHHGDGARGERRRLRRRGQHRRAHDLAGQARADRHHRATVQGVGDKAAGNPRPRPRPRQRQAAADRDRRRGSGRRTPPA
jgi:hypothetical protein